MTLLLFWKLGGGAANRVNAPVTGRFDDPSVATRRALFNPGVDVRARHCRGSRYHQRLKNILI
jgi:hypothetical protein